MLPNLITRIMIYELNFIVKGIQNKVFNPTKMIESVSFYNVWLPFTVSTELQIRKHLKNASRNIDQNHIILSRDKLFQSFLSAVDSPNPVPTFNFVVKKGSNTCMLRMEAWKVFQCCTPGCYTMTPFQLVKRIRQEIYRQREQETDIDKVVSFPEPPSADRTAQAYHTSFQP